MIQRFNGFKSENLKNLIKLYNLWLVINLIRSLLPVQRALLNMRLKDRPQFGIFCGKEPYLLLKSL